RPREAEDAVLVLDLQLLAHHSHEQLVVFEDAHEAFAGGDTSADDARLAPCGLRGHVFTLPRRPFAAGLGRADDPTALPRAPRRRGPGYRPARARDRSGCAGGST